LRYRDFVVGRLDDSIECAFHLRKRLIVGRPDAVFEPMMDLGSRKSPIAADAATGQLTAFGEFQHGCWHHV
jgi:hypothetical protein